MMTVNELKKVLADAIRAAKREEKSVAIIKIEKYSRDASDYVATLRDYGFTTAGLIGRDGSYTIAIGWGAL